MRNRFQTRWPGFPGRPVHLCVIVATVVFFTATVHAAEILLFEELFEDADWTSRGGYDGPHMEITADEHIPGSGHSCVWHWEKAGATGPKGGGARMRLEPVDNVTLSFYLKHSDNWEWTGVPWHPHEFHFITSADSDLL